MAILWATGFEHGSVDFLPEGVRQGCAAVSSSPAPKTGNFCCKISSNNYMTFNVTAGTEFYLAVWVYVRCSHSTYNDHFSVLFQGGDSTIKLGLGTAPYTYRLWIGSTQVATGTHYLDWDKWHHLQVYVKCADTNGRVVVKVDGITDIDYTGDTKSGSSAQLTSVKFSHAYSLGDEGYYGIDDLCIRDDQWPGDIRFVALVPDGDITRQWTPSSGSDHYALVDEVPPSDSDYIYTSTSGARDMFSLSDFDATGKEPIAVTAWARGWKNRAEADQLKLILSDGTNEVSQTGDLMTTPTYIWKTFESAPDMSEWTDEALDNLRLGVEAIFV